MAFHLGHHTGKKTHMTAQICPPSTLQVHQSAVRTLLDTSSGCVPSASIMYTWTKTVSQGRFCAAEVVIKQPKNSPKSSSSSFQLQEMSNTCRLHSEASRSFCRHLIIRRRGSPVSCPSTPATIFISSPPQSCHLQILFGLFMFASIKSSLIPE